MAAARKERKLPSRSRADALLQPVGDATSRPTILLVEDETGVRELLERLLSAHGFRVLTATDGHSALAQWHQSAAQIDLLLTDVVMPHGVSGCALAEKCTQAKPSLKVIYMSGYNMELSEQNGRLRPGINYLQKPYRSEELIALVRAALAAGPQKAKEPPC